jgi:hypothetical protein
LGLSIGRSGRKSFGHSDIQPPDESNVVSQVESFHLPGENAMKSVRQIISSFLRTVGPLAQRVIVRPETGEDSQRVVNAGGEEVSL